MPAPENYSVQNMSDFVGHDFGTSRNVRVDQVRINTFADVTEDHQWIHVDVEKAQKHSPFGGPIAHGFLTLSLVASVMNDVGIVPPDAKGVINYGVEGVRFLAPVPAGSEISASFKLLRVEDKEDRGQLITVQGTVHSAGQEAPSLVGEFLALVIG